MAYRDYIHCFECDVKLIYDGDDSARDILETRYGSDYRILCPVCIEARAEKEKALKDALEKIARADRAPHSYMTAYAEVVDEARAALATPTEGTTGDGV